uniref:Uncharacterized protein n=1 Tax=Oryza nivara TaxID=4536 RepID=A0A0E0FEZ2_ORYNI
MAINEAVDKALKLIIGLDPLDVSTTQWTVLKAQYACPDKEIQCSEGGEEKEGAGGGENLGAERERRDSVSASG